MSRIYRRASALQSTSGRLRTAAGRIRLAHGVSPRSRAGEFSRAILHRYASAPARWPVVDLILKRPWPAVTIHRTFYQTQVSLSPRVALTVLSWLRPPSADAAPASESSPHRPMPKLDHRMSAGSALRLATAPVARSAA